MMLVLIIVGLSGCNEVENKHPTVNIYASETDGFAPFTVNFTGEGYDSDGVIISYYWKFGDGGHSGKQNLSHTFEKSGQYKVTLIVEDDDGAKDLDIIKIFVNQSESSDENDNEMSDIGKDGINGEVITHESNESTGFSWFSYIPNSITKDEEAYILIEASYLEECDQEKTGENALQCIKGFIPYAESNRYVLLTPAFYQRCVNPDIDEWICHFPSYIFTISSSVFYRIDLKLTAMIDELSDQLNKSGYNIQNKVFLMGFSCGGHIANRYSLLHPERVMAFSAGGLGGQLTLPEKYYNGYKVNWVWGLYDYESLTGEPFKKDLYLELPHYIYMGDQDLYDSHLTGTKWKSIFGGDIVTAVRNQCLFEKEHGYNVTYKEYQGVGHEYNQEMIQDTFDFFEEVRYNGK